jgi:excisionase family DNA binding protein
VNYLGSNLRTTKEISELLQVSEETVRRWIRSGDLTAHLDGKSYLVEEETLNEFIKEKSKISGTSISKKMAPLLGGGAIAAVAALNPILGGVIGAASLINIAKSKSNNEKNRGKILAEMTNESTFELKDIETYIQALHRKKKKAELEYQMKLLEIDDEIEVYIVLRDKIERSER